MKTVESLHEAQSGVIKCNACTFPLNLCIYLRVGPPALLMCLSLLQEVNTPHSSPDGRDARLPNFVVISDNRVSRTGDSKRMYHSIMKLSNSTFQKFFPSLRGH